MNKNFALDFVRVTEAAAIASTKFIGKGDSIAADQAAVDAMRKAFNRVDIDGEIVIGEGERDEAPMLFIGEKVGRSTDNCSTSRYCIRSIRRALLFAQKLGMEHFQFLL